MMKEVGSRTGQEKELAAMQTQQSLSRCDRAFWSMYWPSLFQFGLKWEMSVPSPPTSLVSRYWCPEKGSDLVRRYSAAEADPTAVSGQQVLWRGSHGTAMTNVPQWDLGSNLDSQYALAVIWAWQFNFSEIQTSSRLQMAEAAQSAATCLLHTDDPATYTPNMPPTLECGWCTEQTLYPVISYLCWLLECVPF